MSNKKTGSQLDKILFEGIGTMEGGANTPIQRVVPVDPPNEGEEKTVNLNFQIPESMRAKWKSYCGSKRIFLRDLIMETVNSHIQKNP